MKVTRPLRRHIVRVSTLITKDHLLMNLNISKRELLGWNEWNGDTYTSMNGAVDIVSN